MEMFRQFLTSASPFYHLFGVAESRFGNEVDDVHVRVEGYSAVRQDRNTQGGGVVLYVRNTLKATILCSSKTDRVEGKPGIPEYIMCSVQEGSAPSIFVALIYRPPGISFTLNSDLVDNLAMYSSGFEHRIVMGDLNANMLSDSHESIFLKELACDLNLKLVEHGATHHVGVSHTWIDVILVDDDDLVLKANNAMPNFPSRHNLIDVELRIQSPLPLVQSTFKYRNFKSINQEELLSLLALCDWSVIVCSNNSVDVKLEHLTQNLMRVVDVVAPLKEFKPQKKSQAPWVDAGLKYLYGHRDAVRRRYKRSRNENLRQEFHLLASEAEQRTIEAQSNFIQGRIFDALQDKKNVWKELRDLGLLPRAREELHGFSPGEMNAHFAGVSISPVEQAIDLDDIVAKASDNGFAFNVITFSDVVLAVAHFKSQATGEDGIPQRVIAKALPAIGGYLAHIFNVSLMSGIFPAAWKRAQLVPLKKKPIPSKVSDFRPIALLSFLSKVLEKIVHDQISAHIISNNLLDPRQSGFREHHSTQTALLSLTESIRAGIDDKNQLLTILLLFDFSKAFDTISPSKLLHKLVRMGFSRSVILWMKSYISDRNQRVVTKTNGESDWISTNLGVPQGSVLGPLLFSLYINDITDILAGFQSSEGGLGSVDHLLYADDLQVYTQVTREDLGVGVDRLSAVARAVSAWASDNALNLNFLKTKAIIFGSEHNINRLQDSGLGGIEVQDNVFIPFDDTVTNLGVIMDSKLTWKPQVDAISRKVNRALYGLRSFRSSTTEALRKQLVSALAISHLDYCSLVYLDVSGILQTRLQRLQNSCVRYVYGVRRDEHITPYRKKLGWLSVESRREYFMAVQLYKAICMSRPSYLATLFVKNQSRTSSRDPRELIVPGSRTNARLNSFSVRGACLWNSVPRRIRHQPSLRKFKSDIFNYILSNDCDM